jgi:hypothetical protein
VELTFLAAVVVELPLLVRTQIQIPEKEQMVETDFHTLLRELV